VEGLVNGWWIGGEGGLLVGRIGGKGGRVKDLPLYSLPLLSSALFLGRLPFCPQRVLEDGLFSAGVVFGFDFLLLAFFRSY